MAIEINIRLDATEQRFTNAQFNRREKKVATFLEKFGRVEYRRKTLWQGPLILLTARVDVEAIPEDELYRLASLLQQECIGVYDPARNEGLLIGPKAAHWGPFDLVEFDRYDQSLNLKQKPPPYIEKIYVPDADPIVVAQQMEAMKERIAQVFTREILQSFAPQQIRLTDNAIQRVEKNDGPEALSIPRLEGIYELVTEHLWCDALTAVVNALPEEDN